MKIHYVDVPDRPGTQVIAMHFDGWVWGERPHTFHGCPYYKVERTTKVMPQITITKPILIDPKMRIMQKMSLSIIPKSKWHGMTIIPNSDSLDAVL